MLLFKGALVSLLLPLWAAVGLAVVAVTSFTIATEEDPAIEQRVLDLGFGSDGFATLEGALIVAIVVGLGLHLAAAVATSRAVAAMAGSIGGLLGTVVAGVVAIALAAAPSGDRVDALQALTNPAAVGTIGAISFVLGFRAYLAHVGRWRYAKRSYHDHWDNGWDDGGD